MVLFFGLVFFRWLPLREIMLNHEVLAVSESALRLLAYIFPMQRLGGCF